MGPGAAALSGRVIGGTARCCQRPIVRNTSRPSRAVHDGKKPSVYSGARVIRAVRTRPQRTLAGRATQHRRILFWIILDVKGFELAGFLLAPSGSARNRVARLGQGDIRRRRTAAAGVMLEIAFARGNCLGGRLAVAGRSGCDSIRALGRCKARRPFRRGLARSDGDHQRDALARRRPGHPRL